MVWGMRSILSLTLCEVILKRFAKALADEKGMTAESSFTTGLRGWQANLLWNTEKYLKMCAQT